LISQIFILAPIPLFYWELVFEITFILYSKYINLFVF
jgi:hypothetical protein